MATSRFRNIRTAGLTTSVPGKARSITETVDTPAEAAACASRGKLRLSPPWAAFDASLGCSGYAYGICFASMMISSGMKRIVLLVGDTLAAIETSSIGVALPSILAAPRPHSYARTEQE